MAGNTLNAKIDKFYVTLYQSLYFIFDGQDVIIMAEQKISIEICFIQSYSFPQVFQYYTMVSTWLMTWFD